VAFLRSSSSDARRKIETWRQDYNQQRPHSSLDYLSPAEFARTRAEAQACAGINFEPGKEGAVYRNQCWTSVDQKTTGIVRAKLNQNLSRNIATECPAWRSWFPWAPDILLLVCGPGRLSVGFMCHLFHLNSQTGNRTLPDCRQVFVKR
jgi:hypothetical protein